MTRIRKAVIPAAGLGTRFLPATKAIPKEMLPIVNRPAIQLIVEEAAACGIEQVIIITGRGKTELVDHFDAHPQLEDTLRRQGKDALLNEVLRTTDLARIVTVRQQRPLGLGHAILCARDLIDGEPFVVFLPDDLIDADPPAARQLIDVYERTGKSVLALMEVAPEAVSSYGIAAGQTRPEDDRLIDIDTLVEKPPAGEAPSNLAVVGRYVLSPRIFDYLSQTRPGRGDEIQLTDALARLALNEGLIGDRFTGSRYDAGDMAGYLLANLNWARKEPRLWRKVKRWLAENE